MSCGKTQEFLASHEIAPLTQVDAKKKTLKLEDAMEMLKDIDHVYAAKGKKVVHFDMKAKKPTEAELAAVLLGPTGNLRAPTLRKGRTLIVGFEAGMYGEIFGSV